MEVRERDMKTGAVVGAAVAALSLVSSAGATSPGKNGLIAFSMVRGRNYELMVIRPDGTGLRQLTRNTVADGQPAWSPDGKRIAFVRDYSSIWTARADGSGARKVTAGSSPAWAPNGRRIAFARNGQLAVMNADGSGVRVLVPRGTYFGEQDGGPSWSPDGKRIAFIRTTESGTPALWVVGANGSGLRRLTASDQDETDPDWAPDGFRIVFARHHFCGGSCDVPGLVTIRPDGAEELDITDWEGFLQPSWSPNGKRIVTMGPRPGLTILSSSGQLVRVIAQKVSDQGISDPAWQPVR
ncbi:MAG TPA: hypothetical protein VFR32_01695 [Gaiellaceae bacterium]|nr:hypothetical protein [Gaiellaceae bacterium]